MPYAVSATASANKATLQASHIADPLTITLKNGTAAQNFVAAVTLLMQDYEVVCNNRLMRVTAAVPKWEAQEVGLDIHLIRDGIPKFSGAASDYGQIGEIGMRLKRVIEDLR